MAEQGFAQLKDGRMFYRVEGTGDPVLLLHPLGTSSWVWHDVQPVLAKRFTVYALDMLGAGDSDKPARDPYALEQHAHNVVSFMDAMKTTTAHLVGNSIGALLAVNEAGAHPDRVRRMVIIGAPGWTAQEGAARMASGRQTGYDAQGLPKPRTLEEHRVSMPKITPQMAEALNAVRAKSGVWAFKTMEALSRYDVPSHLDRVRCPTLVVYGDRDALGDKKDLITKGIAGSRLHIIPNAGHIPQLERPDEVARVVSDFLSQPAAQQAAPTSRAARS